MIGAAGRGGIVGDADKKRGSCRILVIVFVGRLPEELGDWFRGSIASRASSRKGGEPDIGACSETNHCEDDVAEINMTVIVLIVLHVEDARIRSDDVDAAAAWRAACRREKQAFPLLPL